MGDGLTDVGGIERDSVVATSEGTRSEGVRVTGLNLGVLGSINWAADNSHSEEDDCKNRSGDEGDGLHVER